MHLQPMIDEDTYGGFVVDFPGHPEAGSEFGGFYFGERVTFSRRNVVHVKQLLPGKEPPATVERS